MKTERNISLGYILVFLNNLFFWMAPWLLYMLRFIDFGQVAIVQAVGLGTRVVMEVPSGVLADLLGKKKTLIVAFLMTAVGEMMMVIDPGFYTFIGAFLILNTGYSFYSGTIDAFMFDTLVVGKKESQYPRVLSRQNAIMNGAIAVAAISGGLMYRVWIGLPFVMTGIAKLIGAGVVILADEPVVDTQQFSWRNFLLQTREGMNQLFSPSMRQVSILLLTFGSFSTIAYEILDDASVVAFGYSEVGIGVLYSVVTLIAIPFSLLYEKVSKKFGSYYLLIGSIGVLVLNYLFSPRIGIAVWTGLFLVRVMYSPIKDGAVAELINTRTPSWIRATTISTYELLRKVPFLILAGFIGTLMDEYGVQWLAFWFAITLLVVSVPQIVYRKMSSSYDKR